jgi:ATP-dependent helicase/nuclease subunit A
MTVPNDATLAQIDAARPDRSTWLSANAGSGKTRVLTDRVARLLLDEVEPQHILCLTYTKAAASEMQNRLFKRLGEWAMLPDARLRQELDDLGVSGPIAESRLLQARRLFARAIETPGGLKIQTIHSFCASLLRRFPLESGVSPGFTEMDDRAAALLREEIVEEMSQGSERGLVAALARYLSDDSLVGLTGEIVGHADGFSAPLSLADALAMFGLPPAFDDAALLAQVFTGDERAVLDALLPALRAGGPNDNKAADKLAPLAVPDLAALPVLESVFLTGASAKTPFSAKLGSFPTKPTRDLLVEVMPTLEALMQRVEDARELRLALAAAHRTHALHGFAHAFLGHYVRAKQRRGWLDFDDLINRARALLTDARVAQWVLYRLDGGIDHILVDEAQDTSPAQWNVIERLAQELTSGLGARADVRRTIFVVGDKKQSIYSFQGADPREFDRMQAEFAARLGATGDPLQSSRLLYSFRSSHAVLSLVDRVFDGRIAAGFVADQDHRAFHADLPGRVDLWPHVTADEKPEKKDWHDPVDLTGPDHPVAILARQIAARIRGMIQQRALVPVKQSHIGPVSGRPVHAGDFLILVRRRSPLFHAIIRECKALDLPVAGADRLRIGGELAVRDVAALLRFLATPEDDLSLAAALRSPLFGWSEQQLFSLAHARPGYLWEALRDAAAQHPGTLAALDDLRRKVDFLRPYDLIERILTRHDGRRKLLARLGPEAEDGIDALLAQALNYERVSVPSLTGFLVWLDTDEIEIKRQMESAGARIRVMTVHGAKGLESPIVILPDTAARPDLVRASLLPSPAGIMWKTISDETPAAMQAVKAEMLEREREERDRLLYVAMTRAEKWLIVAAAGDLGKDEQSWYDQIRLAMEAKGALPHAFDGGDGLRLDHGNWALSETDFEAPVESVLPPLPPHLLARAPIAAPRLKSLSPSDLGGAKALADEAGLDEEAALRRGRQVHRLLEFLPGHPRGDWPAVAAQLLSDGPDAAGEDERALLLAEAQQVLTRPGLAPLFAVDALPEVAITATLPALGDRRIHGIIDRLVIGENEILAVDFKTNAAVPDTPSLVPDGLLRQMGAYAAALQQIYPGKTVETALLWTRNATLMRLPHDLVAGALRDTQMP